MATATEKTFLENGRQVGSVFILPPRDAIRMVEHCRAHGIDVFGIEGFRLVGDRIQPQQEHSCDLGEDVPDRHGSLVRFLADRLDADLWFEVVADEPT